MSPRSSTNNVFDSPTRDACNIRKHLGTYLSLNIRGPKVFDHFFSKLRSRVLLSDFSVGKESSLLYRIKNIIPVGSKKQVCRIAASWNVASMTYTHSVWYGSVCHLPGNPVCHSISMPKPKCSILMAWSRIWSSLKRCFPQPAFVGSENIHLAPKPFFSRLSSHRSLSLICATLSATQGARALLFSHMAVK